MNEGEQSAESETAIRRIIERRREAVARGDVEGLMADIADDAVTFDVIDPLRNQGSSQLRTRTEQWVGGYDGPPHWEDREIQLVVDDRVAFAHCLSHVTGRLKTGASVDMWFRTTLGLQRRGDRWWIVHVHASSPFDPATGKASLTLKP